MSAVLYNNIAFPKLGFTIINLENIFVLSSRNVHNKRFSVNFNA